MSQLDVEFLGGASSIIRIVTRTHLLAPVPCDGIRILFRMFGQNVLFAFENKKIRKIYCPIIVSRKKDRKLAGVCASFLTGALPCPKARDDFQLDTSRTGATLIQWLPNTPEINKILKK